MWRHCHRCVGGLNKKLYVRSGSQRHRHFVGFFNVPLQAPTRDNPFYGYYEKPPHFSRLLRCAWGYRGHVLISNSGVLTGSHARRKRRLKRPGWFLGITVKRLAKYRCLDGHVKEPYEMSTWRWEPDRRFNLFSNQSHSRHFFFHRPFVLYFVNRPFFIRFLSLSFVSLSFIASSISIFSFKAILTSERRINSFDQRKPRWTHA